MIGKFTDYRQYHCVDSARIGRVFLSIFSRIQSECGKIRTTKNPNWDTGSAYSNIQSIYGNMLSKYDSKSRNDCSRVPKKSVFKMFWNGQTNLMYFPNNHFPEKFPRAIYFPEPHIQTDTQHATKFLSFLSFSHPQVFCRKGVLKNFAKFTEKHLYQSLF